MRSTGTGPNLLAPIAATGAKRPGGREPSLLAAFPIEPALLPHVHVGHEHEPDEHHHLDQTEQSERSNRDGPREEEDGLDVEDDEQHRNDVELYRESLVPAEFLGFDTTLV